ncbi:MAG TPA: winged helix-turn-helix domain-containing protein [Pyrinomonadaceae bacterium]|nr:winged helix-turn-helix domain-containing protein [Pyrinomonadaceae bacterium]
MLLENGHLFEFGPFRLDPREKILLRDNLPVSVTPRVFETLQVLVENPGRLLEKDELMQKIWRDRFVEDGNLAFTIKTLRRVLKDDARRPRFIETVPRRGYRFIARVSEISGAKTLHDAADHASPKLFEERSGDSQTFTIKLVLAAAAMIIGVGFAGYWFAKSLNPAAATILTVPFASEKLSTSGKVRVGIISPDGKILVYINGTEGKQSVWLRQLDTANNVEVIPPSDDFYYGLALSPDSNFLYFSRKAKSVEGQADIYRVSILGGIPTKIIAETQGSTNLSADGRLISFVRCYYRNDEYCSLWIADASDGRNERKLVSRPHPIRIGDSEISPDGRSVVFAVGQSENQANEFGLSEIDVETGTEHELTAEKFFNIKSLAWLPDKSGLLMTAARIPNRHFRIWQVSAVSGVAVPLTNDSESYTTLSLDKGANRLVSARVVQDFRLHLLNMENPSKGQVLADASSVAFAPDGKIIFSSQMTGNDEIWSVEQDGTGQRQLTSNAADELYSIVSPARNSIFFSSNRTGEVHVWRMNADGSDQTQITRIQGGRPLFVSPDGNWLYYHHGIHRTLWRVSTDGGEEKLIVDKRKNHFAVSPDGLRVAFSEKQGDGSVLVIMSLTDGSTVKTFKLADERASMMELEWSADGDDLAYILAVGEFENKTLWFQPLDEKSPRQIANFGDEQRISVSGFALAPDGKTFAVVQGGWRHDAVLITGLK